jgi:hypothetical protein
VRVNNPCRSEYLLPDRKHRLLACGLCRRIAPLAERASLLSVLETSEAFADGLVTVNELARARHGATQIAQSSMKSPAKKQFAVAVVQAASLVLPSSLNWFKTVDPAAVDRISRALCSGLDLLAGDGVARHRLPEYVKLFDDVEPHRVTWSPEWRTSAAVAIAQGMYDAREFSGTPILADALQDAGCDSAEILDHCRGPGPHIRGCWVIDLVLGKE